MKNVEVLVKEVSVKSITVSVPDNVEDVNAYCWEQINATLLEAPEEALPGKVESSQVELVKVKQND